MLAMSQDKFDHVGITHTHTHSYKFDVFLDVNA